MENEILTILLLGITIFNSLVIKSFLEKYNIPSIIGYFVIGFSISLLDRQYNFLNPYIYEILEVLAKIGIICLLFRVGLECKFKKLLKHSKKAKFKIKNSFC
jgi:monovalent cation:H+ antiporter-2, CPA2 family